MTAETDDGPLLRHTDPAWRRPLPGAIAEARRLVAPIADGILAIPEPALTRPWAWIGGGEEEVRYGVYRLSELFERAEIEARRELERGGRRGRSHGCGHRAGRCRSMGPARPADAADGR